MELSPSLLCQSDAALSHMRSQLKDFPHQTVLWACLGKCSIIN